MTKKAFAIALLILPLFTIADAPEASAVVVGGNLATIVHPTNQDTVVIWANTLAATASSIDLTATEIKDLNSDGDFGDAGEVDEFVSAQPITSTCTDVDVSPHFTCDMSVTAGDQQFLIWRNNTARHRAGNYSILIQFRDAVGVVQERDAISVRLTAPSILSSDTVAAVVETHEDQDTILQTQAGDGSTPATSYDLNLARKTDPTNGGTITSTNIVNLLSATSTTCASQSTHLACAFDLTNRDALIVWKNSSAQHVSGNYTLKLTWKDSGGGTIRVLTWSIRVRRPYEFDVDAKNRFQSITNNLTTAHDNLTTLVNNHDKNETAGETIVGYADQDTTWTIKDTELGIWTNAFDFDLIRRSDLTGSGAYTETIITGLADSPATDCATISAIMACTISSTNQEATFTWKNASSTHVTGNYTFHYRWEDGVNTKRAGVIAIQLLPGYAQRAESYANSQADANNRTASIQNAVNNLTAQLELIAKTNLTAAIQNNQNNLSALLELVAKTNLTAAIQNAVNNLTAQLELIAKTNLTAAIQNNANNLSALLSLTEGNVTNYFGRSSDIVDEAVNDTTVIMDFGRTTGTVTVASTWTVTLKQWRDLDNDGDFDGVGEQSTIAQQNFPIATTQCSANVLLAEHLSCLVNMAVSGARSAYFIWRQADPAHVSGNYTLQLQTFDGASTQLQSETKAIHLIPPRAPGDTTTTEIITNPANALNDNIVRFTLAFTLLAGLTFMAIQRSFVIPLMAFFGSLAFMFFLFAVGDFFTLESTPFTTIVYQVFKMTPMIPFAIGGFNAGIGFASTRKGGEPS